MADYFALLPSDIFVKISSTIMFDIVVQNMIWVFSRDEIWSIVEGEQLWRTCIIYERIEILEILKDKNINGRPESMDEVAKFLKLQSMIWFKKSYPEIDCSHLVMNDALMKNRIDIMEWLIIEYPQIGYSEPIYKYTSLEVQHWLDKNIPPIECYNITTGVNDLSNIAILLLHGKIE